jgi:hypothetical protein
VCFRVNSRPPMQDQRIAFGGMLEMRKQTWRSREPDKMSVSPATEVDERDFKSSPCARTVEERMNWVSSCVMIVFFNFFFKESFL